MNVPCAEDLERHRRACEIGEDTYASESGLIVFTSVYLREQGSCCGQTCRHCPWPAGEQARAHRDPNAPSWPWTQTYPSKLEPPPERARHVERGHDRK